MGKITAVAAKLLAPKWHSAGRVVGSDPFFLGWIRTKASEKNQYLGVAAVVVCKRRWRRRRRKLKRKCGTLETCSAMTRGGDVNVTALLLILPRTCCCCPGDRYPSLQNGRRPGLCNMPLPQGPYLPKELLYCREVLSTYKGDLGRRNKSLRDLS